MGEGGVEDHGFASIDAGPDSAVSRGGLIHGKTTVDGDFKLAGFVQLDQFTQVFARGPSERRKSSQRPRAACLIVWNMQRMIANE